MMLFKKIVVWSFKVIAYIYLFAGFMAITGYYVMRDGFINNPIGRAWIVLISIMCCATYLALNHYLVRKVISPAAIKVYSILLVIALLALMTADLFALNHYDRLVEFFDFSQSQPL